MDLVDLNSLWVDRGYLLEYVEILMDLVDLNQLINLVDLIRKVEILMDLVDLNSIIINLIHQFLSRDPYGSRGSKSPNYHLISYTFCRDPYGSRGSKLMVILVMILVVLSRSLWISWI